MSQNLEDEIIKLKAKIESHAEARRIAVRKWASNNKDKKRELQKIYESNNRQKINDIHNKWVNNNKEHLKTYQSEYRAKKKSEKFQQKLKDDIAWNEHKKQMVEDIENVKFPIKGFENMDN